MNKIILNIPIPEVVGLYDHEAREVLVRNGFIIGTEHITQTTKQGQPEGGLRVVRQRVTGREVHLVLAYEKWVCVRKEV